MGLLTKTCVVLAGFGGVNWALSSMFQTDAITAILGPQRTIGTDMLHIIVALASLYAIAAAFLPAQRTSSR